MGGDETVTLLQTEMPTHNHLVNADNNSGNQAHPSQQYWAASGNRDTTYSAAANVTMNQQAIGFTGGNQPHDNMQPYLAINYIIALTGIYPPRS